MKECKYRHKEDYITGYWGDKKIVQTRYSCYGQKDAPSCEYRDVNDCDKAKPVNGTNFDKIIKGTPEQLAEFVVDMMELGKDIPECIDYKVILAALNSEVDSDE